MADFGVRNGDKSGRLAKKLSPVLLSRLWLV